MEAAFIDRTEEIEIEGTYQLPACSGYLAEIVVHEGERPTVTYGDGFPAEIAWFEERGQCPALDTYTIANLQLHTKAKAKIGLLWLMPVVLT